MLTPEIEFDPTAAFTYLLLFFFLVGVFAGMAVMLVIAF
jgi:hypothetical protein